MSSDKLAEAFKRWWGKEGIPFPVNGAHYMTAWNAWRASALAAYDAQPAQAVVCDRDCDCVGECKAGIEKPAQAAQPVGVTDGWPEYLMLRDTGLHDDAGGLGQRIFTTAGAGYKKVKYVRVDLATAPRPPAQPSADAEDAARYRWIRDMRNRERAAELVQYKMNLDTAIDAAMAKESGQ